MKKILGIALVLMIAVAPGLQAQTVIVTDDNAYTTGQASAVLDIKSTTKGVLMPRMTEAQRLAITTPATGLVVYQTDATAGMYLYNGTVWSMIATGATSQWITTGSHIYYNTGNVGIGTATPAEALDITGNLKFSGAIMPGNDPGTLGYVLTSAGVGGTPTWTDPASYLTSGWQLGGNTVASPQNFGTLSYQDLPFITNNVEKMRILANGNVGIGLTAPTQKLDVSGNLKFSGALMPNNLPGAVGSFLMSAGANTPPTWGVAWAAGGNDMNSAGVQALGTTTYHELPIITNNTTKMMILENGNVGIGNIAPSQILDVTGNFALSGAFMPNGAAGTAGAFLTSAGPGQPPTWTSATSSAWQPGGNNMNSAGVQALGTTTYHELPIITNNTTKVMILENGNVGVGNVAPNQILDVTGNIAFSGALMPNGAAGSAGSFLTSAGPGQPPTWTSATSSAWQPGGNNMNSAGVQALGTTTYHELPIITNNTTKMMILENGNVGIGNVAPNQILDVTGNMALSGAFMPGNDAGLAGRVLTSAGTNTAPTWGVAWVPGGNNLNGFTGVQYLGPTSYHDLAIATTGASPATTRIMVLANGRVGISNTAPAEALDVTGNLRYSGALMPGGLAGTSGQILVSAGTNTAPTWANVSSVAAPAAGSTSITTLGTIGTGTWQGSLVNSTYGGTGVNNAGRTITVAGNFATAGANALTLTTTGATNVTLPTTGTLVNSAVTTLSSLTSIGTIGTGTWQGTVVSPTYGGTGVNNGSSTLTLAGNLATSGANALTLTTTGATNVTLPTTGTLVNSAVTTLSSLTSIGTIGTGTWQGSLVNSTYGGTGVNNAGRTITVAGNFATAGANALTLTTTGATNVTLPTSGTLVNDAVTTLSSLTSIGNCTTGSVPGALIAVRQLTSGTSYTPTTGTKTIIVHMVGGGGGGGGVTSANSRVAAAGGGGSGSYLMVDVTGIGAGPYTYAIGAAGAGATAGANAGGTGGNTTLTIGATTYTANGGSGGTGMAQGNSLFIAGGGTGAAVSTNGDLNTGGNSGSRGIRLSGTVGESGNGAPSQFGSGGDGRITTGGAGNAGIGYGSGGGGALSTTGTTSFAGGAGTQGIIIIYEYR